MKILLVTPIYPPDIGGPATYSYYLKKKMEKEGVNVEVITLTPNAKDCIVVPRDKGIISREFSLFNAIRRHGKDADVIYALDPLAIGIPALFAGKRVILRYVGDVVWEKTYREGKTKKHLEEFLEKPDANKHLLAVERYVLKRVEKIIVPAEYLKNVLIRYHGIKEKKIEVVPNFIVMPDEIPKISLKKPSILFVGRLVKWKGLPELIKAFNKLRKKIPELRLNIIGEGPMENEIKGEGIKLMGKLTHETILGAMKDAGVLVLYSSYEGLSHVLIEGSRIGVPVVASNSGGNAEVVCTESIAKNETELNEKIEKMLTDKKYREEVVRKNKEKSKKFTIERHWAKLNAIMK